MLTILNTKYTLSEVVTLIKSEFKKLNKNDPTKHWDKCYLNYLMKINGSGSTKFKKIGSLIEKLEDDKKSENHIKNIHSEAKKNIYLERRRGQGPGINAAMRFDPINRHGVNRNDFNAINNFMNTGNMGNGIIYISKHQTDPETGLPKGSNNVGVKEYYVNGQRRLIKRTEQGKTTYYYSNNHYLKYIRLE